MNILYDVSEFVQTCIDEVLAMTVVGGYMIGIFMGVEVPMEMPAGILAYYFVRKS